MVSRYGSDETPYAYKIIKVEGWASKLYRPGELIYLPYSKDTVTLRTRDGEVQSVLTAKRIIQA